MQSCWDSWILRFHSQFWYTSHWDISFTFVWKLSLWFMNSVYFIQLLAGSGILKKNIWSNYWHIWSNYWQLAEPYKRIYDPIIGSFIHSLDNAASDIHVPISLLLIQILDIIFQSIPKSHYISSSFWVPGRNFTKVYLWSH